MKTKKLRLKKQSLILLVFISVFVLFLLFFKIAENSIKNSIDLKLTKSEFEYGEQIKSKDIVESVDGEIVEYPILDTSQVGSFKLVYGIKKNWVTVNVEKEVVIHDTQFPVIEFKENPWVVDYGIEIDLKSNVSRVVDPIDGDIEYKVNEDVALNGSGDYQIEVSATDSNGNETVLSYTLTVKEKPKPEYPNSDPNVKPTYINGILLVNKQYPIPANFGGYNAEANNALSALQNAAANAGYSIPLLSGYRSYSYQASLYSNYVSNYGQAAADTFSARPGHSEHQTGLAFDVGAIDDNYGNTAEGQWLNQNCANYGFILRYQLGKENITGYKYEPWHIRYVGVDHAKNIMSNNLTLEEYLGV